MRQGFWWSGKLRDYFGIAYRNLDKAICNQKALQRLDPDGRSLEITFLGLSEIRTFHEC